MAVQINGNSLKYIKGSVIDFQKEISEGNTVFVMEFWVK